MSVLWADGFGHWGTIDAMIAEGYAAPNCHLINDDTFARTGSYYISIEGGNFRQGLVRNFDAKSKATLGGALRFVSLAGRDPYSFYMRLANAANDSGARLWFYSDGSIGFTHIDGSPIARTAVNVNKIGTWNYYELQVDVDTGHATVRMNNVVLFDVTDNFGANDLNIFSFGEPGVTEDQAANVADIYLTSSDGPAPNNSFLGDVRCRTLLATQAGPDQAWVVTGAADAVSAINNVPPDPAKYIAGQNVGDLSDFAMGLVPANTSYCAALVVFTTASKTDAGDCQITPQLQSGGLTETLTPITPAVAPATYVAISETDPQGNYWNKNTVNGLRYGVQRTG